MTLVQKFLSSVSFDIQVVFDLADVTLQFITKNDNSSHCPSWKFTNFRDLQAFLHKSLKSAWVHRDSWPESIGKFMGIMFSNSTVNTVNVEKNSIGISHLKLLTSFLPSFHLKLLTSFCTVVKSKITECLNSRKCRLAARYLKIKILIR